MVIRIRGLTSTHENHCRTILIILRMLNSCINYHFLPQEITIFYNHLFSSTARSTSRARVDQKATRNKNKLHCYKLHFLFHQIFLGIQCTANHHDLLLMTAVFLSSFSQDSLLPSWKIWTVLCHQYSIFFFWLRLVFLIFPQRLR